MSKTVDERVVQMKFDNRQFEQGVSQTMSTLDKFKQKLNLTGASKGLDDVQKSAKDLNNNMSFNNAEKSLTSLEKRFSTLGVAGMTVIQNLTNSMMNFAKKISDYSIGGIITGGKNRATKIENARFQIKGLLRDYADAEKRLNDIMADVNYGVESTAYGLDAAATVAAQLVASGIQAGDGMKKALRGISGVAAMTNSSYEEIGRIYTKIAGNGRLMGEELLQLSSRGMNAAAVLAKSMNKTEAEVRDMVSKGKISFETFSKAMDDAFGEHAKDANKTLNGVLSNIKAALAKVGADFFTPIIEQESPLVLFLNSIRERINDVRKNLKVITKETTDGLNSFITKVDNWFKKGETHRFGFSPISEILKPLQKAENVFETVTETAGRFSDKIKEIEGKINKTLGPLNEAGNVVKKVTDAATDYHKIVDQIIYGTWDNGRPRLEKLTEAGINYYKAQNMVNERLGAQFRYSQDIIDKQDEMLGLTKKQTTATENYDDSEEGLLKTMQALSDEELKQYGLTDDQVQAFRELDKVAKMTGLSMSYILNVMKEGKFDTRFLIFNSLKNIGSTILTIFKAIGQAFMEAFQISDNGLFSLIASFHRLTELIKNFVQSNAQGLTNIFKGIFSILHLIVTIITGAFKAALHVVNTILEAFGMNITDLIGQIGLMVFNVEKWITADNGLVGVIRKVVDWLSISIKNVILWIKSNSKILEVIRNIKNAFVGAGQAFNNWFEGLRKTDNIPKYIFEGLINGIKEYGPKVFEAIGQVISGLVETVKNLLGIHSPSKVFFAIGGFIVAGLTAGIVSGETDLFSILKGLVKKVVDFFKGINLGNLIATGLIGGTIFVLGKALMTASNFINGAANVMNAAAGLIWSLEESVRKINVAITNFGKAMKYQAIAAMIKGLTLLLAAVVASIVVLGNMNPDKLKQGGAALGIIAAVITGMTIALWAMSKRLSALELPSMGTIFALLLGTVAAIGMVVKALEKITKLDPERLPGAIKTLLGIMIGLGGLIAVIAIVASKIPNEEGAVKAISKLSNVMLKVGLSMLIIAKSLQMMNKVEWDSVGKMSFILYELFGIIGILAVINHFTGDSINKSAQTIMAVGGCLLILAFAMKIAGGLKAKDFFNTIVVIDIFMAMLTKLLLISKIFKNTEMVKVSGSILLVTIAIGMLAIVARACGSISPSELAKGLTLITVLGSLVAGLIAVAQLTSKNSKEIFSLGTTMLGIAIVIGAMAAAVFLLGQLSIKTLAKGITAVGLLTVFVSKLVEASKEYAPNKKAIKTLAGITIMIAVLAGIAVALSFIEISKLAPAVAAVDSMVLSLATLIKAVGKLKFDKGELRGTFIALITMTAIIGIIGGLLILMSNVSDTGKALQAAIGISALLMSMVGFMYIFSKIDKRSIKIGKNSIVSMIAIIGAMAGLALVLNIMKDTHNAIQSAVALTILMGAMAGVIAVMALTGKLVEASGLGVLAAVGVMLALTGIVGLLTNALNSMNDTQNAIRNATALSELLLAMSASVILLSVGGLAGLGIGTLVGVLALYGIMPALNSIVDVLRGMEDIPNATKNAKALGDFMTLMGDMLFKLSLIGPLALIADVAIYGMVAAITAVGVLATAIGALNNLNPDLELFVDVGLKILAKIAEGIGAIFGSVIKGFIGKISEILPMLGEQLSAFAENVEPFVSMMSSIDGEKVIDGVGKLALAILALSGAQIVSGISKFLGLGTTFTSMGLKLRLFGESVLPFLESMENVPDNATEGIKRLAEAVAVLTTSNLIDSISRVFFGSTRNLSDFEDDFTSLGRGIKGFADALDGNINMDSVKTGAEAIKILAEASKELPTEGGWLSNIFGDRNISSFGGADGKFAQLAEGLRQFSNKLGDGFDADRTRAGAEAVKNLAQACKELPNEGGWISKLFAGEKNIGQYGGENGLFAQLAEGLRQFSDKLGEGFDGNKVKDGAAAIKDLAQACKDLGPTAFEGLGIKAEQNFDKIKENLPKLGEGLKALTEQVKDVNMDSVKIVTNLLWSIGDMAKEGGYDVNGHKLEEFGACFTSFAYKLAEAIRAIATIDSDDKGMQKHIDSIDKFNQAASKVNEMQNSNNFTAERGKSIEEFGACFTSFVYKMKEAFENLAGIQNIDDQKTKIDKFVESVSKLKVDEVKNLENFANSFNNTLDKLSPKNGHQIEEFGACVDSFANKINHTFEVMGKIPAETISDQVTKISSFGESINSFASSLQDENLKKVEKGTNMLSSVYNLSKEGGFEENGRKIETFGAYFNSFGWKIYETLNQLTGVDSGKIEALFGDNGIISKFKNKANELGNIDSSKMEKVAETFKTFSNNNFNSGHQLEEFGACFASFAYKMKEALGLLSNEDLFKTENMSNALSKFTDIKNATDALAGINDQGIKKIEDAGNKIKEFLKIATTENANNIEYFAGCFASFGWKLWEANNALNSIKSEDFTNSLKKVQEFTTTAGNITKIDKSKIDDFANSFKQLGDEGKKAFVDSMSNDAAKTEVTTAVNKFVSSIKEAAESTNNINAVKNAFDNIGNEAYQGINWDKEYGNWRWNRFVELGKHFVQGFAKGISDNKELVAGPATEIGKYALLKAKESIDSNSPSKETMKIGNYFSEGFAIGIGQYASEVGEAASNMGKYASEGLQSAISKVYDVMNLDGDTQPTIRPVLDLSDVESGVGTLSSMLDINKDMSLNASLNSISTSINRRLQNRGNDDIISAIKDLSNSISGNTGNTYNVNGVAYSDSDTEVTNAIRTLVNAAVVERRT